MSVSFRHWAEGAVTYVVYGVFACLPVSCASALGGRLGRVIGPRLGISRRARRNLENAFPQKNSAFYRRIVQSMWENLGRVIGEYPHLDHLARHAIVENNSGVSGGVHAVYCAAHLGNWELPSHALVYHFAQPVSVSYRAPNNPIVDTLLNRLRTSNMIKAHSKSKAGGIAMLKDLKSKRSVAILSDQKYNEGERIPFFDHDAMTNPAVAVLAQKFDVPIIPVQCVRVHKTQFKIILHPPIDHTDKTPKQVMQSFNTLLEAWVTVHPEQWLWLHNRWADMPKKK